MIVPSPPAIGRYRCLRVSRFPPNLREHDDPYPSTTLPEMPDRDDGSHHPGPSGYDFHAFECPLCDYVHEILVTLVDPMISVETSGWLQGELRAPT
jgi:hypothetical protein